jgi:hypothetical protein
MWWKCLKHATVDHGAAVGLDPLEGTEEGEVVGNLEPKNLVALCRHCVDHDVAHVLPAIAAERLEFAIALLIGHCFPTLDADSLLDALHDGIGEQAARAACAIARVGAEHRVLRQPVQPNVVRRWVARRQPAEFAAASLVIPCHPLREEAARVHEDAPLNVGEHSG